MLKLPRNRVAVIPIFDSADTGIRGYDDAEAALGFQKPKSGNIFIHDEYKERVDQGIVKYVGSGVTREKNGFGIGDMVIFSGYSGQLVSIEGEGLYIILPARFVKARILTEPTVVSGLYFKSSSPIMKPITANQNQGEYFPATYEKAMELIAKALEETSVLQIKKDRPALEDYSEVEEEDDES